MSIIMLLPAYKSYIWGGNKLKKDFGMKSDEPVIAEAWELSCHPDGQSVIRSGMRSGETLRSFIEEEGPGVLGRNCERFRDFPILIKLIDANDALSVQVHPDDAFARKYENQYGKTEMWYVIDCEPGATLYFGFKRRVSKDEFRSHIEDGTLIDILNEVPVRKGDTFFIEAGTVHAIGKGIVIAEIQQNSNVTYRVYDYGRVDAEGNLRELHIDKALECATLGPAKTETDFGGHLASCGCFTVDCFSINSETVRETAGTDSFRCILVTDGEGEIRCGGEKERLNKGDCAFITAGSGEYEVSGNLTFLRTYVPEQK